MKTKGRLTVLLGVMLLLVTVLAAVSLATIWKLRGEGMAVIKANYNSIAYMQAMVEALDTLDASHDTAERRARLTDQIRAQQQNMTEPGEREATERLAHAMDSLASAPTDPAAVARL